MIRLLLLLTLSAAATHAQTWELLNPRPTTEFFYGVARAGDTYVFAGTNGVVGALAPGADSLDIIGQFDGSFGRTIVFSDATTGWIGEQDGLSGAIHKTTDGGRTWTEVLETAGMITHIDLVDAQTVWAAGSQFIRDRVIVRTTDGGQTWTDVAYPRREGASFDPLIAFEAFDAQTAVAIDRQRYVYRTTDAGVTWDTTRVEAGPEGAGYSDAHFFDDGRGWLVGTLQTILTTDDGGQTWTRQLGSADSTDAARHSFNQITFSDPQTGWAATRDCLYRTADGGQTWTPSCTVGTWGAYGLLLDAEGTGFLATGYLDTPDGESLGVLRTEDGGETFTNLTAAFRGLINAAAFGTDGEAWGAGGSTIVRTTTGWRDVEVVLEDPSAYFQSVATDGDRRVWVVGFSGAIRASANGGDTWTAQGSGTQTNLNRVAHLGDRTLVVIGDDGLVLRTEDDGATWDSLATGVADDLDALHFRDAQNGWAAGERGRLLQTTDGGVTWTPRDAGVLSDLQAVFFASETHGYLLASDVVYATTDGGATWALQPTPATVASLSAISFVDEQRGWIAADGAVLETSDGGATWAESPGFETTTYFRDVHFVSPERGWVFGGDGAVVRYTAPPATATEADTPEASALAVYPNPTAGPATLAFALGDSAEVTVTVHDALGRAVARQRLALGVGEHRLALPGSLAPGLYVVTAEASGDRLGATRFTVVR
ncbi:MAG TPA: T9SS type A sorting domain-containing protein [Bacteroidetes bacterium]|nr:T9SS type A sorting domain-containing protein [Bacteroidota bacterium]